VLVSLHTFVQEAQRGALYFRAVQNQSRRSDSGDEKKHMSILIPKTALSDALQRSSNFEEKGFHERAEEPPDLPEAEGD
jgi:hypothetical protein